MGLQGRGYGTSPCPLMLGAQTGEMAGTHCTPIPLPQFSLQAQEICEPPKCGERGSGPLHSTSAGLTHDPGDDPTEAV